MLSQKARDQCKYPDQSSQKPKKPLAKDTALSLTEDKDTAVSPTYYMLPSCWALLRAMHCKLVLLIFLCVHCRLVPLTSCRDTGFVIFVE